MAAEMAMVAPNPNQRPRPLANRFALTVSTLTPDQALRGNFRQVVRTRQDTRSSGEKAAEFPVLLHVTLTL